MTIHQLKTACFVLDQHPEADENLAHYESRAEAVSDLTGERDGAAIRVRELPYLCWVAECDAPDGPDGTCGDTLGDEDEGPACVHFERVDELFAWMPGESWTRTRADGALCWTHSPDGHPSSPAAAEIDGQIPLPGVA